VRVKRYLQALINNITTQRVDSDICTFRERELKPSFKINLSSQGKNQINGQNQANTNFIADSTAHRCLRCEDRERVRDSISSKDVEIEMSSNILEIDLDIKVKCFDDGIDRVLEE